MAQPLTSFEEVGRLRTGSRHHAGGIPQKYVLSEQQRRLLLERYDGRTETLDALMPHFPGVPRYRVRQWAAQLGLARTKEPPWTQADEQYLRTHLHKQRVADIARHLGRTQTAVRLKARRLAINKCGQQGYTMRGVALGLGVDVHKVSRWVKAGWLKGRPRQTDRPAEMGDVWLFTDAQIRAFVRAHPQEIDLRRVDKLWFLDVLLDGLGGQATPEQSCARADEKQQRRRKCLPGSTF